LLLYAYGLEGNGNMNKRTLEFLLALALPLMAGNNPLAAVKKIYVGSIGGGDSAVQSDEATRIRLLLTLELTKAGFTSVDAAEKADAVLTGVLVIRDYTSLTVLLSATDGKQLWGKNERPWWTEGGFRGRDNAQQRAQDIARALRKEVASAAKGK
jgi:hypothetical protein